MSQLKLVETSFCGTASGASGAVLEAANSGEVIHTLPGRHVTPVIQRSSALETGKVEAKEGNSPFLATIQKQATVWTSVTSCFHLQWVVDDLSRRRESRRDQGRKEDTKEGEESSHAGLQENCFFSPRYLYASTWPGLRGRRQ